MTGIKISEYDQEIPHSLQTDPWHLEEEAQNNNSHNTSVRQLKLKKLIKMIARLERTHIIKQNKY